MKHGSKLIVLGLLVAEVMCNMLEGRLTVASLSRTAYGSRLLLEAGLRLYRSIQPHPQTIRINSSRCTDCNELRQLIARIRARPITARPTLAKSPKEPLRSNL